MTCCETTQEKIKYHLEESEGETNEKTEPFVGIKEDIMPDPENLSEVEKDDKEKKRELDVKKLEKPASEESIGDMVVTHIYNLFTYQLWSSYNVNSFHICHL